MKPVSRQQVVFFSVAVLAMLLTIVFSVQRVRGSAVEADTNRRTAVQPQPSAYSANSIPSSCRYGVAALWTHETAPWLPYVGGGWYLNFGPSAGSLSLPNHAEYVHTLRMKGGVFDPPLSSIDAELAYNPGELWLVGNEIEVKNDATGDGTYPEDYAVAYHTAYNYIKQRDPSAQVAIGGMSMATPGRLQYLDLVWDAYLQRYGEEIPVDVWNIHIYILNEWKHFGNNQGDGKVALGTDPSIAKRAPNGPAATECPKEEVYCRAEHDSLTIFDQQIRGMRQWMKDHGQQDKPLIITEFGLLFQPSNQDEFGVKFPPSRVNTFMTAAFDYLDNAKDASIGYPRDENRLVQQWLWYGFITEPGWSGHSSDLLKQEFREYALGDLNALNSVGLNYRAELQQRTVIPNLVASSRPATFGDTSGAPLRIGISNNGTAVVDQPFTVTFYADAALTQPIGSTTVNTPINGCHWHDVTDAAEIIWNNPPVGIHTYWAKVNSDSAIGESNAADNVASGVVYVEAAQPTPTPTAAPPDPEGPIVTWISPVGNGEVHAIGAAQSVALQVNASDPGGVQWVAFERWDPVTAAWVAIAGDGEAPYTGSVASADLRSGHNQISAIAWDQAGNRSESVSIWLFKGTTPPADTPTPPPTPDRSPGATPTPGGDGPELRIGSGRIDSGKQAAIPLMFDPRGAQIGTAVFGIDFDQDCLTIDSSDIDNDGIPDSVQLNLPPGYLATVAYSQPDTDGELDILITRQDASAPALPTDSLMTITFKATCDPPVDQTTTAEIVFAASPAVALATLDNQPVNGQTTNGAIVINGLEKAYLPNVHASQ